MAQRNYPVADPAPGGVGVIDDGAVSAAIALAQKGVDQNMARQPRRPDVLAPDPKTRDETPTKVVCVVDNRPWTHERPLSHREQTEIPRWVADLMAKNGQVVIVN